MTNTEQGAENMSEYRTESDTTEAITIRTNNQPRDILTAHELTEAERGEFDYHDWLSIQAGTDSASFFRYHGTTYDLGEFSTTSGLPADNPLRGWDGYVSDSFFSGVVVRFVDDCERIIVGTFFA